MTKAERAWKDQVAQMCCVICERLHGEHEGGYVELHHLRKGGWGKGDYKTLIPLCVNHHRGTQGIHTLGTKAWEKQFDVTQMDLLEKVQSRMKANDL
jgi:Recombination enhancement, RecA-dependent nuclease